MNDKIDQTLTGDVAVPPVVRFYDMNQISWGTFLGGPMAGCWFLSTNWRLLGEGGTAFRTLVTGIVGTMAMLVAIQFLPDNIPHFIIPAAYTAVLASVAKAHQKAKLDEFLAKGGKAYSSWRALFVSFLWLGITLVLFVALGLLLDAVFPGFLPDVPDVPEHK